MTVSDLLPEKHKKMGYPASAFTVIVPDGSEQVFCSDTMRPGSRGVKWMEEKFPGYLSYEVVKAWPTEEEIAKLLPTVTR